MRKLIVCNFITVDGYYEGKDRDIVSLFDYYPAEYSGDQTFDSYNVDVLRGSDTLLLSGRTSFMGNKSYWTGVPNDPNATPIRREFAKLIASTPKVVVSETLDSVDEWQNSTLIKGNVVEELTLLKQQPGKNIGITGSGTLVASLLRAGLLDELNLLVHPIVVGKGKRLFASGEDQPRGLRLADAQTFSTGVLNLMYTLAET